MIIDCHTHIGRNEHINASVDELLISMDKAGIDKAMVFASRLGDAPNEWVLEQVNQHKDRLYAVAAVRPKLHYLTKYIQEDAMMLHDLYAEGKIVGAKFYVGYEHYLPAEAEHYLWAFNEVGCPAIFHSGDCLASCKHAKLKFAHPIHIDEVAVDYPKMNFIIAHMGFPWQRDAAEVCYKNANVYADISGFVYGDFKPGDTDKFKKVTSEFIEICPSDKLLFGTDFPISNQLSYKRALWDAWGDAITPEKLSLNVKKAFKLK